jgi:hypothetical protein
VRSVTDSLKLCISSRAPAYTVSAQRQGVRWQPVGQYLLQRQGTRLTHDYDNLLHLYSVWYQEAKSQK